MFCELEKHVDHADPVAAVQLRGAVGKPASWSSPAATRPRRAGRDLVDLGLRLLHVATQSRSIGRCASCRSMRMASSSVRMRALLPPSRADRRARSGTGDRGRNRERDKQRDRTAVAPSSLSTCREPHQPASCHRPTPSTGCARKLLPLKIPRSPVRFRHDARCRTCAACSSSHVTRSVPKRAYASSAADPMSQPDREHSTDSIAETFARSDASLRSIATSAASAASPPATTNTIAATITSLLSAVRSSQLAITSTVVELPTNG